MNKTLLLDEHDEESYIDNVCSYMESATLLHSEDQGMSQLLHLNDTILAEILLLTVITVM